MHLLDNKVLLKGTVFVRAVYFQEKSFLYTYKCKCIKMTLSVLHGKTVTFLYQDRQTESCLTDLALSVYSAALHSIQRALLYPSYNEFQYTSDEVMKSFDSEFEI